MANTTLLICPGCGEDWPKGMRCCWHCGNLVGPIRANLSTQERIKDSYQVEKGRFERALTQPFSQEDAEALKSLF